MKITFLGTGTSQGVPVIACSCDVCLSNDSRDKRLRSSVKIETDGKTFVIDTGPDFRQQMLRSNTVDLTAIIFTHEHKDHVAGLDDVRAFNYALKRDAEVFCTDRVAEALKTEFHYAFSANRYPGVPRINLNKIENEPFEVSGTLFTPIEVMHFKLPTLGFRIGDFTYITDAKTVAPEEIEKIKGSKVLVVNALRKEDHISHFTLEEALDFIEQTGVERAYLTHISHLLGTHEEVSKELPPHVTIACDQEEITL